jgi:hypothetical protein
MWLGCEADCSTRSSAEVKNVWGYTFTTPYVFMVWCLVSAWDNFTFFGVLHALVWVKNTLWAVHVCRIFTTMGPQIILVQEWPKVIVGTHCCTIMTWDLISATMTWSHFLNNDLKCDNGFITLVQQWSMLCGMKNVFGMSVFSKEYTFLMLFVCVCVCKYIIGNMPKKEFFSLTWAVDMWNNV